jgi:Histidine kinase-like ATPase domain
VSDAPATLELELAADPALLATARLFAAAAARAAGCDDLIVEDVRLAVSEACAASMRGATGDERVSIGARVGSEGVSFAVEGPSGPSDGAEIAGLDLVAALFPSASTSGNGGRTTVRFDAPNA